MKQKLFYLLAFIFCLSFFPSAKQSGKICYDHFFSQPVKLKCQKQFRPAKKETGPDVPFFNIFLFNI